MPKDWVVGLETLADNFFSILTKNSRLGDFIENYCRCSKGHRRDSGARSSLQGTGVLLFTLISSCMLRLQCWSYNLLGPSSLDRVGIDPA